MAFVALDSLVDCIRFRLNELEQNTRAVVLEEIVNYLKQVRLIKVDLAIPVNLLISVYKEEPNKEVSPKVEYVLTARLNSVLSDIESIETSDDLCGLVSSYEGVVETLVDSGRSLLKAIKKGDEEAIELSSLWFQDRQNSLAVLELLVVDYLRDFPDIQQMYEDSLREHLTKTVDLLAEKMHMLAS